MTSERCYRVSELAHRCAVNPRTVDYYTVLGLLNPVERSKGGHRFYDEEAVYRLQAIKALQAQGLPLEAIRQRLDELGSNADLLARIEHLQAELLRLEGEVAELGPQLASVARQDVPRRAALQAQIASAATSALTLSQELMELLNRDGFGLF